MTIVPRLWPESTIACLATGPSLTREDVERVHAAGLRTIAVNEAVWWAPWADVAYAADRVFWTLNQGLPAFAGLKYVLEPGPLPYPDVQRLLVTGTTGLEADPWGLRTGYNSGYQAIGVAVHLGARRVLLLGYDMHGDDHFFGRANPRDPHPNFRRYLDAFQTLVPAVQARGVEVVNCTRGGKLECFPRLSLDDALAQERQSYKPPYKPPQPAEQFC